MQQLELQFIPAHAMKQFQNQQTEVNSHSKLSPE